MDSECGTNGKEQFLSFLEVIFFPVPQIANYKLLIYQNIYFVSIYKLFKLVKTATEHVQYVGKNWSLADDVAYFIILLNLIGQLLGSFFILIRFLVTPSVLSLFALTIGQTVIYTIFYEPKFLLRHMAMMGALMILLAEHQGQCLLKIFKMLSKLINNFEFNDDFRY